MRSTQNTSKSSNEKEDDLISITDIKATSDKPIISSSTNYEDIYESFNVWVIPKLTSKDVFEMRSNWSF